MIIDNNIKYNIKHFHPIMRLRAPFGQESTHVRHLMHAYMVLGFEFTLMSSIPTGHLILHILQCLHTSSFF